MKLVIVLVVCVLSIDALFDGKNRRKRIYDRTDDCQNDDNTEYLGMCSRLYGEAEDSLCLVKKSIPILKRAHEILQLNDPFSTSSVNLPNDLGCSHINTPNVDYDTDSLRASDIIKASYSSIAEAFLAFNHTRKQYESLFEQMTRCLDSSAQFCLKPRTVGYLLHPEIFKNFPDALQVEYRGLEGHCNKNTFTKEYENACKAIEPVCNQFLCSYKSMKSKILEYIDELKELAPFTPDEFPNVDIELSCPVIVTEVSRGDDESLKVEMQKQQNTQDSLDEQNKLKLKIEALNFVTSFEKLRKGLDDNSNAVKTVNELAVCLKKSAENVGCPLLDMKEKVIHGPGLQKLLELEGLQLAGKHGQAFLVRIHAPKRACQHSDIARAINIDCKTKRKEFMETKECSKLEALLDCAEKNLDSQCSKLRKIFMDKDLFKNLLGINECRNGNKDKEPHENANKSKELHRNAYKNKESHHSYEYAKKNRELHRNANKNRESQKFKKREEYKIIKDFEI